ncbi:MAG: RagB/SusD family nutrient uptake outer membrane protein [Paludibacter sp.]|nr:RagB/SusD family nutrient uptake outer membrane protein [Paludibacter sp.]
MKKIKYSILVLLTVFFTACDNDKFFEVQRAPESPWNSVQDLEFAAVSPYAAMMQGGWGAIQSNHALNQVIMSDYFRFLGNVEGYATDQVYKRRFQDKVADVEALYKKLYYVIGLANTGLEAYRTTNDNPFPFATDDDKQKNVKRIKGELLFMRAYAYYHLAINYCPVYGYGSNNDTKVLVKRDKATFSSIEALDNAPVSTGEIYDLIVSDLKEAKLLLPEDYTEGMHASYDSRSRANKWAASAFLAQVYFTMQKFTGAESALTELDDVIANGGYSLEADPFTNFNNQDILIKKANNKEVIFWAFFADNILSPTTHNAIRFTHFNKCGRDARNGGNGNNSGGSSPTWSNFQSWIQLTLAKNALVDMGWMNADGSEPNTAKWDKRYNNPGTSSSYVNQYGLFYRYEGAYADTTAYRIAKGIKQLGKRKSASDNGKYIVDPKYAGLIGTEEPVVLVNKYFRSTDGRLQNIPLIRLAELYLNRAMIKKKANIGGWAADYNLVAKRAWNATLAGSAYIDKSDADISEHMLLVERWKELAGEDSWYIPFCEALGLEIGQGDRIAVDNTLNITAPYTDQYWKNCIPQGEIDFQNK